MKLYDCKVRLGGSVMNEVRKSDVTAAEVVVLRLLHGADAVADIVETGETKRSGKDERQRLYEVYANPEMNSAEVVKERMASFRSELGHDTVALPSRIDPDDPFLTEQKPMRRARKPADLEDAVDPAA